MLNNEHTYTHTNFVDADIKKDTDADDHDANQYSEINTDLTQTFSEYMHDQYV